MKLQMKVKVLFNLRCDLNYAMHGLWLRYLSSNLLNYGDDN